MAVNLSALSTLTSSVTTLSNLILVSPQNTVGYQPLNPISPDGTPSTAPIPQTFVFNYEGEQSVTLESDITDHYVEDNSAVQDQIALKPPTISTQGFIGELNDVVPAQIAALQLVASKLTAISGYAPALTTTALLAYTEALFLYETAKNAVNSVLTTVGTISGSNSQGVIGSDGLTAGTNQNAQQTAFQQFFAYWQSRTLFNVQTPWAVFQNMALTKVRPVQDAETDLITTFEVSFKMIRVASTQTAGGTVSTSSLDGRLQNQAASPTVFGTNPQGPSSTFPLGSNVG